MGFGSFLGETTGKMLADAKEAYNYKLEYQHMNNDDLEAEYKKLKSKSSTECRLRRAAVQSVLKDRGCNV